MRSKPFRPRAGFALLAVLWVLVGLSALSLAAALTGREALAGARNRVALTRASWIAEGCSEMARAAIGEALGDAASGPTQTNLDPTLPWQFIDREVSHSPLWAQASSTCELSLVPGGAKLDISTADGEQLRALFGALSTSTDRADSLADALLDWQDADSLVRPRGAERDWYVSQGLTAPSNAPIHDLRELARVRGFEPLIPTLDSLVWTEPGRLLLDHAPLVVLASLPGFSPEVLSRIAEWRARATTEALPRFDFPSFSAQLSPVAVRELAARFKELGRLVTNEPEAWYLTARAAAGDPPVTAEIDLKVARSERRAAIVRRRTRP